MYRVYVYVGLECVTGVCEVHNKSKATEKSNIHVLYTNEQYEY